MSALPRRRADGAGLTTLITGPSFPFAIDVSATHLYWSELNSGKIRRSNLDGSNVQDLLSGIVAYTFEVTDDTIFQISELKYRSLAMNSGEHLGSSRRLG